MWLRTLRASGLRCFTQFELDFSPGLNVIVGGNGVGKTSILEGISVLSCGKSFRTSKLSHVINHTSDQLVLFGIVNDSEGSTQLGVQTNGSEVILRHSGSKISQWSVLAKILPVLDIHPESYLLISGGPIERRKFLNWGMFHVEQNYSKIWSDYSRALKQRNIALKNRRFDQAKNWHKPLAELGNQISSYLTTYTKNIQPHVNKICDQFEITDQIELRYDCGWDRNQDLRQLLDQELLQSSVGNSTIYGPHRGNLVINWKKMLFSKSSSRGQQKVMAIALKLAQAEYLMSVNQIQSIYLIDELPAELDEKRRKIALDLLNKLNSQIIISAVSKEATNYIHDEIKWFHVEQSGITSVL